MAKHMDDTDRDEIERLLRMGWLVAQIASKLGRPGSTVAREIRNRRIDSNKGVRRTSSATCALYDSCRRTKVCPVDCGMRKLCKNCACCVEACADFLPPPDVVAVRLQRLREGAELSAAEEVLHRRRTPGPLRGTPPRIAPGRARLRRAAREDQRGVHAVHAPGAVREERHGEQPGPLRLLRAHHVQPDLVLDRQPLAPRPRGRDGRARGTEEGREVHLHVHLQRGRPRAGLHQRLEGLRGVHGDLREALGRRGPELFKRLFAIIVTDNDPEFSDPVAIEANPLFVPRGEDGKKFLDALGIRRIEPNDVNLTPMFLGEKFARHAASVILHRNKADVGDGQPGKTVK